MGVRNLRVSTLGRICWWVAQGGRWRCFQGWASGPLGNLHFPGRGSRRTLCRPGRTELIRRGRLGGGLSGRTFKHPRFPVAQMQILSKCQGGCTLYLRKEGLRLELVPGSKRPSANVMHILVGSDLWLLPDPARCRLSIQGSDTHWLMSREGIAVLRAL